MNPTKDEYLAMQLRCEANRARRAQDGSCAIHEEPKDDYAGKINHKARKAKVDAAMRAQFRISIDFRFSDRLRRDLDGEATTILDCLVATRRRLLDMCAQDKPDGDSMC